VRLLVGRAFLKRSDADVEIVEAFDGFVQCHRDREAKETAGGKGNRSSRRVKGFAPRDGLLWECWVWGSDFTAYFAGATKAWKATTDRLLILDF
jgi:hypothetical protein